MSVEIARRQPLEYRNAKSRCHVRGRMQRQYIPEVGFLNILEHTRHMRKAGVYIAEILWIKQNLKIIIHNDYLGIFKCVGPSILPVHFLIGKLYFTPILYQHWISPSMLQVDIYPTTFLFFQLLTVHVYNK